MMRRVIKLAYTYGQVLCTYTTVMQPQLAMTSYFIKVSGQLSYGSVPNSNDGTSKSFRDHPILLWEQSNKFLLHFHGQLGHDLPD